MPGSSDALASSRVKVHLFEEVDLSDHVVVDGFPSVGLVSTICANYLIDLLDLTQIGVLDGEGFPTVSIVREGEPLFPVRIYAGEGLCVFVSEFQPEEELVRPIAETVLSFAKREDCSLLLSPEGLVSDEADEEVGIYGLGSTVQVRERLQEAGVERFENGIITGVSGVLVSLGKRDGIDVASLLAEANPSYPDARAAARVIEAIDGLIEEVSIDVEPLYTEAENIESTLRSMQQKAGKGPEKGGQHPMYG